MKHRIGASIAAVLACAAAMPAAASSAEAKLENLHVQLVDLDAGDGIAATIRFQDLQGGTFVGAESGRPGSPLIQTGAGGGPFGAASSTSADVGATASSSMSGDAFGAGAAAIATASADRPGIYGGSTVQLGDGNNYMPFTLSAHTRLVISADASASAMSTLDGDFVDTFASAFLKLTDASGQDAVSFAQAIAEQFGTGGKAPQATTDARHIEVSFENLGATSLDGIFFSSVDAYAADLVPVPEPANLTLLAAGLGLLAWRVRTRRA